MKSLLEDIKRRYANLYGVEVAAIEGKSRKYPLPEVRARIIHEFRNQNQHVTLQAIGEWMGGMDHSSVISAIRNVEDGYYGPEAQTHEYRDFVNLTYKGRYNYILTPNS